MKTLSGEVDKSYSGYVVQPMGDSGYGGRNVFREYPDYKVYREDEYKSVLPKDQEAILDMLGEMSRIHKFDLTVIDVTKENFLRRLWHQRIKRISAFPTLVSDRGERIQGRISQEQVKALIRHRTTQE